MSTQTVKQQHIELLSAQYRFIIFRNQPLFAPSTPPDSHPHPHWQPLTPSAFARSAYQHFPYATISQLNEAYHRLRATAEDVTSTTAHLIGTPDPALTWDTSRLRFASSPPPTVVLRSPITPLPDAQPLAQAYLTELADGDTELAGDIAQALAPLFMATKPTGVIWFIGGGANGKSALINAIYRIIGDHLSSLTVADIEDGRDTPRLNGVIGNVCRESSEGRIADSERYKAIGTHEPFDVHKFHSQEMVRVEPGFHTVFNANNIPVFADKTEGARRRTLIVPFPAKFRDDPTFEQRTFTPEFLGGLFSLLLDTTHRIKRNGYRYDFSARTQAVKDDYDAEVNSVEAFLKFMRKYKVQAFSNFTLLRVAYEAWCQDEGLVPLGLHALRRVMKTAAKIEPFTVLNEKGVEEDWFFIDDHRPDPKVRLDPLNSGILSGLKAPPSAESLATPFPVQSQIGDEW